MCAFANWAAMLTLRNKTARRATSQAHKREKTGGGEQWRGGSGEMGVVCQPAGARVRADSLPLQKSRAVILFEKLLLMSSWCLPSFPVRKSCYCYPVHFGKGHRSRHSRQVVG